MDAQGCISYSSGILNPNGLFSTLPISNNVTSLDLFDPVGNVLHVNSTDCFTFKIEFNPSKVKSGQPACAYFQESSANQTGQGNWSVGGCHSTLVGPGVMSCCCTHLTEFSIFVTLSKNETTTTNTLAFSLVEYVIYGGIAAAVVTVLVIFTIFVRNRMKKKEQ